MTLDDIRREQGPFPTHILRGVKRAVCFFCAGFLGHNVEIHLVNTGCSVYGIDLDADKLAEMTALYPSRFVFKCADAYDELAALQGRTFDLVTADPQLDQMERCFDLLPQFRALGGTLVLGIHSDYRWRAYEAGATDIMHRSGDAWWAVFP